MAGKAKPYNVVVGDKGQKSRNVGIAFWDSEGKVPLSITLSLTKLRAALDAKAVTTRKEGPSKNPSFKNPYEGDEVLRIVGFEKTRKGASGNSL